MRPPLSATDGVGAPCAPPVSTRRHRALRVFLAAAFTAFAALAAAQTSGPSAPEPEFSAADRGDIAKIEHYLNGIGTMTAKFLQLAPDGTLSRGRLYLSRPGRLRVEYAPPSPILIVANGRWLIYHDFELEQTSYQFLEGSFAGFLVRETIKLDGEVIVTGLERRPGVIAVKLIMTDDPDAGRLTLTFSDQPLMLRRWAVTDSQGLVTQVALFNPRFSVSLDEKLFEFDVLRPPLPDDE
jgi:outer membrane lipoprotein-sorting protein